MLSVEHIKAMRDAKSYKYMFTMAYRYLIGDKNVPDTIEELRDKLLEKMQENLKEAERKYNVAIPS
jgi:transcription initiation factor IIE alpha subunit